MPHYKLTYFDAKGSAEPSRLILAYAGVEYEDVRIPIGALSEEKKMEHKKMSCAFDYIEMRLTYGYLPSLEVDGRVFNQHLAIARYLASKFGLQGEDELEDLRIEELVYTMAEYFKIWIPLLRDDIPEETKAERRKNIITVDNIRVMNYYDKILKKNEEAGNSWLVGRKISWVDIIFAHSTSSFEKCLTKTDILKDYPRLQGLRQRVLEQPGIKEYIANRPVTKF